MAEDFSGTAASYQWYRCDSATPDVPVAIDGATTASYTPTENGIYYVAVTGGNVGYNPYGAEHPEEYTTNGVLAMVAYGCQSEFEPCDNLKVSQVHYGMSYKIIRNFSWLRMTFEI